MTTQTSIPREQLQKVWRIVTWAGLFGSIYGILCISGAPRIKFLTELKATASDFGLIAGLGAFAIVCQIFGSLINSVLRKRRTLWMLLCITHRLLMALVLLAPMMIFDERLRMAWIIMIFFMHDILAQISVPIWLSWMADLVPKEYITRHFAARQRIIAAANIFVMILVAIVFHFFEISGHVITGFIIMAAIGIVMGVADILLFLWVPEPQHVRAKQNSWTENLAQPFKDANFRPFLYYMAYWHFATFVSAPFFSLYMIDNLGLSATIVQLLITADAIGVVMTSRFWGLLCDTYGFRPVLQILSITKTFTPLAYILATQMQSVTIPLLAIMIFLDGFQNGGLVLAMQGVLLRSTPRPNRAMYIAATNLFAIGIMASLTPVLSGHMIDYFNHTLTINVGAYHFTGYHIAFTLSMFLRAGTIFFAKHIREPGNVSMKSVVKQLLSRDAMTVTRLVYRLHESPDENARFTAARKLGVLKNPMAIGELIHALKDKSPVVREAAAEALGRIGASDATQPLAEALNDPSSRIQSRAARALGNIGDVGSLKALLTNLDHQNHETMSVIIDSLAQIGDSAAIVPLICLFHRMEDPVMRLRIAAALGKLGETESVEEVLTLLQGRRPDDRYFIDALANNRQIGSAY